MRMCHCGSLYTDVRKLKVQLLEERNNYPAISFALANQIADTNTQWLTHSDNHYVHRGNILYVHIE